MLAGVRPARATRLSHGRLASPFTAREVRALSSRVERVVLFAGPAESRDRARIQRSIEAAIKTGNYQWRTIRMGKDGRIHPESK